MTVSPRPQADVTSHRSCYSQDGHYSSELLDELKENISPMKSSAAVTAQQQTAVNNRNMGDCLKVDRQQLLIVENMGTPVRRATFFKDSDNLSPKYATQTPERKVIRVDGFKSNPSSPQAVPDCYATPLRRTTFVKNSPKSRTECGTGVHVESSSLCGQSQRSSNVEGEARSHVATQLVQERTINTYGQYRKTDDILRDVSKSPLILEDRLLHLQGMSQSNQSCLEIPRRSTASSRCSPSESEYHTAVTTPYNESCSENEDADEFLDSNICSETITGDLSLCQQHLALKASSDATFVSNDPVVTRHVVVEDLNIEPENSGCVTDELTGVVTSVISDYETVSEVVLKSELYMTEVVSSSHMEEVRPGIKSAGLNAVVYQCQVEDCNHADFTQPCLQSASSMIPAGDFQYSIDMLASNYVACVDDSHFSAADTDTCKRMSSTPLSNYEKLSGTGIACQPDVCIGSVDSRLLEVVNIPVEVALSEEEQTMLPAASERMPGIFYIPRENDSFNSRTVTKVHGTPSFTADMSVDTDGYNRTYTKSAGRKSAANLSSSRSASRSLFTGSVVGSICAEDKSIGVVPFDMTHETADAVRYEPCHRQLSQYTESSQLPGIWSDGEMSAVGRRGVFSQVGGQTRHMISPGQKRQSLIARLDGDGRCHPTHASEAVISIGHHRKQELETDNSPVRKKPLIDTSKQREYSLLL